MEVYILGRLEEVTMFESGLPPGEARDAGRRIASEVRATNGIESGERE